MSAYGELIRTGGRLVQAGSGALYRNYRKDRATRSYRKTRRRLAGRMGKRQVGYSKSMLASTRTIKYLPKSFNVQPLPRCYHTRVQLTAEYLYTSTTVLENQYSIILLNSLGQLAQGSSFSGPLATGALLPYTNPNPDNIYPTGLQYLLDPKGPYTQYTVVSSTIKWEVKPENENDHLECVIIPLSDYTNSDPALHSVQWLQSQPLARKGSIEMSKGAKMVKHHVYMHSLLGVNKRTYLDDLSGNFDGSATAPPAKQAGWLLGINCVKSGNALSGDVTGRVTVMYNVCFWNQADGIFPEGPDNTDTNTNA